MATQSATRVLLMWIGMTCVAPWVVTTVAWEEDVHYVLTFWLATQAGFARNDADQVAQADQSYDDSEHAGAIPTVLWIILRGDIGAARELQLKHFPSDAALPSPPLRRVVAANSPTARTAVDAAMSAGNSGTALAALGEALHPFQDSWSHQGVPDIPYNLRPNLISAHPTKRGGWRSHDADLTHRHVDDAVDMARQTYDVLTQFLDRNSQYRHRALVPWPKLEPTVRAFANARTREAKAEWAIRHVPEARSDRISNAVVAGSRLRMRALAPPLSNEREGQPRLSADEYSSLLETANEFLRQWLAERHVDSAIRHVDLVELSRQFNGDERLITPSAVEAWCGKFLTMQLIDDHDAVNRAGHGDPSHPRYQELPDRPSATGEFRATRTADPPRLSGRDFLSTDVLQDTSFALVLQNEDSVRDALTLVWRRTPGKWSIVRLFAFAE